MTSDSVGNKTQPRVAFFLCWIQFRTSCCFVRGGGDGGRVSAGGMKCRALFG